MRSCSIPRMESSSVDVSQPAPLSVVLPSSGTVSGGNLPCLIDLSWPCLQPTAPVPVPSPADWSNPYLQHQLQQHALIQQSHQQQQHDGHDMKVGEVEESKSKSLKVSVPTGFGESTRCDPASFARLSSVVHRVRKGRGREKVGFQTVFLQ